MINDEPKYDDKEAKELLAMALAKREQPGQRDSAAKELMAALKQLHGCFLGVGTEFYDDAWHVHVRVGGKMVLVAYGDRGFTVGPLATAVPVDGLLYHPGLDRFVGPLEDGIGPAHLRRRRSALAVLVEAAIAALPGAA